MPDPFTLFETSAFAAALDALGRAGQRRARGDEGVSTMAASKLRKEGSSGIRIRPRARAAPRARPASRASTRSASTQGYWPPRAVAPPQPTRRLLRGYAFDPQLSTELESVEINEIVYEVPWEPKLEPGPRGDYLDVIDYDPASEASTSPSTSTIAPCSPRAGSRRPKPTRSSTSRWCTRWRCGRSSTSSTPSGAACCGRRT